MMHYYFQRLIEFAQHNSIMFASIVIISFVAIFILIILLLNPKKTNLNSDPSRQLCHSRAGGNLFRMDPRLRGDDSSLQVTASDIRAIAGDDVCVTQLDLARAYIELGKITSAKQILESVILEGDHNQQQTAKELLLTL